MNQRDKDRLADILKENGYSVTRARIFVCELLWRKEPQSMHDLVEQLDGKIDRASLYRTVQLFEQLGIVHRVYMGWKYKVELSDMLAHHHHHVSCMECGRVVPMVEEHHIEHLIKAIAARYDFVPVSHQLEIQGLCKKCSLTQKDPA